MTLGLTLALDASTYAASAALVRGREVLGERTVGTREERAERLLPAVAEILREAGVGPMELDRLVCGAGPGSFTSLRVAASIAKGIAVASNRPLFAVPSLLLAVAGWPGAPVQGRYVATLDAMRGEVYAAVYEVRPGGTLVELDASLRVADRDLSILAERYGARLLGPGRPIDQAPHARGVARVGDWIERSIPVDLVRWEPDYGRLPEAQVRWEAAHRRPLAQP